MKTRVCLKHFLRDCSILAQCNEEVAKQNTSVLLYLFSLQLTLYKTNPINNKSKFKYEIQNFSFQLQGYILERCYKMCCRLAFWNGRRLKVSCYQLANRFLKNKFFHICQQEIFEIFLSRNRKSRLVYINKFPSTSQLSLD